MWEIQCTWIKTWGGKKRWTQKHLWKTPQIWTPRHEGEVFVYPQLWLVQHVCGSSLVVRNLSSCCFTPWHVQRAGCSMKEPLPLSRCKEADSFVRTQVLAVVNITAIDFKGKKQIQSLCRVDTCPSEIQGLLMRKSREQILKTTPRLGSLHPQPPRNRRRRWNSDVFCFYSAQ